MRRASLLTLVLLLVALLPLAAPGPSAPPAAFAAATTAECRPARAPEKPNATADDLVNCVVERLGPSKVRVSVMYTYASALGKQNIWLGADVLADGNRLKWFGYRPAPISDSNGTASLELVFGLNSPPAGKLTTDQVEFFMYVGGGQVFFRKMFTMKRDWQL